MVQHPITSNFDELISESVANAIANVPYFDQSMYASLDIARTLKFYNDRYVKQLADFTDVTEDTTIMDVGAGYGWLAITFAIMTPAKVIAIDIDEPRLMAAKKIAEILGLEGRIDWRVGGLGSLPAEPGEADVTYCVEVLEHVYRSEDALRDLVRVSGELLVVTTPNLWFPVIAHDTQLPFCHWLPIPVRLKYAKAFDRHRGEVDNLFWSPASLGKELSEYRVTSTFLHYASYDNFKETFPFYLPYGTPTEVRSLGKAKELYYNVASRLGSWSRFVLPSLACVYRRQ